MESPALAEDLPWLYQRWIAEWLPSGPPKEERATCDACVMCSPDVVAQPNGIMNFSPDTKCCTNHPTIPNFLIGLLFADTDPALAWGQQSMRTRIAESSAATPLGVAPTAQYELMYRQVYKHTFGTATAMVCPHYDREGGGRCGIWKYRNGTCATWFCKYNRAGTGLQFWVALRHLFRLIESQLSLWAASETGFSAGQIVRHLPPIEPMYEEAQLALRAGEEIRDGFLHRRAASIWGEWQGREAEFYQATAVVVAQLSWPDVLRIAGAEAAARAGVVEGWFAEMTSPPSNIPERLRLMNFVVHPSRPGTVRLTTYSYNDPIELSVHLFETLPFFDGRPVAEVQVQLAKDQGIRLTDAVIRRLVDYDVLAPATARR